MARVTRSSVLLKVQDLLGIQSAAQAPPVETPNTIQPVVEVGPKFTKILKNAVNAVTGTSTIYTTPTDKDFYLTYAALSVTKDVTCDLVLATIQVTVGGVSTIIIPCGLQSVTAESRHIQVDLSHPVLVDRGTGITMLGAYTAGAASRRATIGGFILE